MKLSREISICVIYKRSALVRIINQYKFSCINKKERKKKTGDTIAVMKLNICISRGMNDERTWSDNDFMDKNPTGNKKKQND